MGKSHKFYEELPSVARIHKATKIREKHPEIEEFRQKYLRKAKEGTLFNPPSNHQVKEAKLRMLAWHLNEDLIKNPPKKPILILVDGPDGVGKTSTINRIKPAFEELFTVNHIHFGPPRKDEPKKNWLKRYISEVPGAYGVTIWDRTYLGGLVYDPAFGVIDHPELEYRYRQVRNWELSIKDRIHVIKFFLIADDVRLAKTLAKREVLSPHKISVDYDVYDALPKLRGYFVDAMEYAGMEMPWHVITMDDRYKGRKKVLNLLRQELLPQD